jgi:hypothetical protein
MLSDQSFLISPLLKIKAELALSRQLGYPSKPLIMASPLAIG